MNVRCVLLALKTYPLSSSVHYILTAPLCFCLLCREKEKPDEGGQLGGGGDVIQTASEQALEGCRSYRSTHSIYKYLQDYIKT